MKTVDTLSVKNLADKTPQTRARAWLSRANSWLQRFDYDALDHHAEQIDHLENRIKQLESAQLANTKSSCRP